MDDGALGILSVAKYYSPNGKAIQDTGVTPGTLQAEAEVASTSDDEEDGDAPAANPAKTTMPEVHATTDAVLSKAYEILKK